VISKAMPLLTTQTSKWIDYVDIDRRTVHNVLSATRLKQSARARSTESAIKSSRSARIPFALTPLASIAPFLKSSSPPNGNWLKSLLWDWPGRTKCLTRNQPVCMLP
jgi:hypothetical protein